MRQICNVSYAIQAEAFTEEKVFLEWDAALPMPPDERPKLRARPQTDRRFLDTLGFGGVGNV